MILDNQVEDKSKNTSNKDNEIATIELEKECIRIEQAKIISIVPANNTNTSNQLDRNSKDTTQDQLNSQQTSFNNKTTRINNTIYNIKTTHQQSLSHQHNH